MALVQPLAALDDWPLPGDWVERCNLAQTVAEEEAVRRSLRRGDPFGQAAWRLRTCRRL